MKYIHSLLFILFFGSLSAQSSFFAIDTVQIIEITFSQSNWDYIMDTTKIGTDGYTLAQEVKVNGVSFLDAGVRYKGNSSYDSTHVKNPLHIKLDFTNNGNYKGFSDIKLSNGWQDPSVVREVLAYSILRNYMDAPLSNFAKVYINGVYYGVYSSSETIDKTFLLNHLYTSSHSFFKCNPANVVNGHIPNLTYLGQDSTLYYDRYEFKSGDTWKDVINLCDTIVNTPAAMDKVLDVDRALWMLAFNDETVNLDSYSGLFAQNYYLYRDHNHRFVPIIWDLNMCFGGFNKTGTANLTIPQMQQLTPLLHATNASRPMIKNLLADATYKKMYIAHLRTMNNEFFANGNYETLTQSYQALIDTSVQSETFGFYNYSQFQNSLTTDIGTVPGIKNLMDARVTYLAGTTEFQQVPPLITNVAHSPTTPVYGSNISIKAKVIYSTPSVYLGYRYKKSDRFVRIPMFDDGAHNDGVSGDNVFGVDILANSLDIQYYIYAENINAGMFSPERAEYEFYHIYPTIDLPVNGEVVINEIVADNQTGIENETGKHKDWIELYNTTGNTLGLSNLYLSDDVNNKIKWEFPANAFIPANGYLVVWADDLDKEFIDFHTNFNLNSLGDSLYLGTPNIPYDSTSFANLPTDFSWGRCPDGSGPFTFLMYPSPLSINLCGVNISHAFSEDNISIYPNPANQMLYFDAKNISELEKVEVFNFTGQIVKNISSIADNQIDVSGLAEGIYGISFIKKNGNRTVAKFVKE